MSDAVIFDAGPLGVLVNPNTTAQLAIGGMDKGDASKVECGLR